VPRTAKTQISFADWELLQQGISLEPLLQTISDFLDDHQEMIEAGTTRSGTRPKKSRDGS
jgi:transposase, IS5 family